MKTSNSVTSIQAAVKLIIGGVHAIQAPFADAIELACSADDAASELTLAINALKCTECPWLFEQGKLFALECIDGAVWTSKGIDIADDADELTLNECADLRGPTKWWIKIPAPKNATPQSLVGKLSAFCKFLDKASKRDGPKLATGETRAQAAKGAQAMALIASGVVTFDDIIALATLPVASEDDAPIAAAPLKSVA